MSGMRLDVPCRLTLEVSGKQRRAHCWRNSQSWPAVVCPLDRRVRRRPFLCLCKQHGRATRTAANLAAVQGRTQHAAPRCACTSTCSWALRAVAAVRWPPKDGQPGAMPTPASHGASASGAPTAEGRAARHSADASNAE
jgi:hypothetical protein